MEDVEQFAERAIVALEEDRAWLADPATVEALLKLAADAAHGIQRPAAPIATFLAGVAVGRAGGGEESLADAVERVRGAIAG
jgi:hypothetical protein